MAIDEGHLLKIDGPRVFILDACGRLAHGSPRTAGRFLLTL
jgi:hypothetical protein